MEAIGPVDVIINAVAYTLVDGAEVNEALATLVNGEYAGKLAEAAYLSGAKFMHISTDYVFAGNSPSPIGVTAPTDPINAYGRSKLLGEKMIAESGARYQIFRTAWLYGSTGNCFPKSIARKCRKEGFVNVVNDQFGQPTWTRDLAAVVDAHSCGNFKEPIVHAVASGEASWYDFALAVAASMNENKEVQVNQISSRELNLPAKRPVYSVLSNIETRGPIIGDWRERWEVASSDVLNSVQ
jgi:dTDP-4-dehydrorhamnose reductase